MSDTRSISAEAIAGQRDAFIERFLQSTAGAFSLFSIYIGDRLGLYRALAEAGPFTSARWGRLDHDRQSCCFGRQNRWGCILRRQ